MKQTAQSGPSLTGKPPSQVLGEEISNPVITSRALGEEGGDDFTITTYALGEEGGDDPVLTTQAIGEEGGDDPGVTTFALGEEGGDDPIATTLALGEEGGDDPVITTYALGEEGGNDDLIAPCQVTGAKDEVPVILDVNEKVGGYVQNMLMGSSNTPAMGANQSILNDEGNPLGDRLERLFELADGIAAGKIHITGL